MSIMTKIKNNVDGFSHIEAVLIIVVLIAIVGIGGYVYQKNAGNSYNKKIIPAFKNQGEQMKIVATSFSRPVWTSSNTTEASDVQDFAYINPNIVKAKSLTNTLASTNKVLILPGSTIFSSAKKLKDTKALISVYVNDSYAFLNDYQALSTYAEQSGKIISNMSTLFSSMSQIQSEPASSSATTPAQLVTVYSDAIKSLDSTITAYKKLTPPADLVSLNSKLITALESVRNSMSNSIVDIKARNSGALITDSLKLISASGELQKVSQTDVPALLEGNSVIHNQITKLTLDASKIAN